MKEFIKELESEFIKLEERTRPEKSSGMLLEVLNKTNNGVSLGELEPKLKSKLKDLSLKYNIEELDDDLSIVVKDLFTKIARNRLDY